MKSFDVIIVGGGISGLHTAFELAKSGRSFKLLEARLRFGGRVFSPAGCDIGPSWVWPGQTHIEKTILELGLRDSVFEQYHHGDSLFEPIEGDIVRGIAGISMRGSLRIRGGLQTIIGALQAEVERLGNPDSLSPKSKVSKVVLGDEKVQVFLETGQNYTAKKVILALPPRVALNSIEFTPGLTKERIDALNQVATWMAGHAKMVALYKEPFWREMGLSGDVFSQKGPLSELHDASSADGEMFSLFGFFATPPKDRLKDKAQIDRTIVDQLTRIFGKNAASPVEIFYKNWADDGLTATSFDQTIPREHSTNYWSEKSERVFEERLIWSGSESAAGSYNGYIEGAIVASIETLSRLKLG